MGEIGKGIVRRGAREGGQAPNVVDDLVVFRCLDLHIQNKKAITACLLVLQDTSYIEAPLDEVRKVAT